MRLVCWLLAAHDFKTRALWAGDGWKVADLTCVRCGAERFDVLERPEPQTIVIPGETIVIPRVDIPA